MSGQKGTLFLVILLVGRMSFSLATYVSPAFRSKVLPKTAVGLKGTSSSKSKPAYWPGNEIPFVFHSSCDAECRNILQEAMKEWENDTCVKFAMWGEQGNLSAARQARNYVIFRADQPGCFTVERDVSAGGGGQSVNLGEKCFERNKVLHELGHVLDLEHVHTRFDRDQYIVINTENVQKDMEDQYLIRTERDEKVPYDYRSIMHYQSSDFSVDPFVKPTMSTKSPVLQYLIDEPRRGLSFYDKKQVNLMYNCFLTCRLKIFCFNQGIPVRRPSGCACLCPPLTTGADCRYRTGSPHHPLLLRSGKLECGGLVKKEGKIQTPNYPLRLAPFESCGWVINAPPRHRIELVFEDFFIGDVSNDTSYYVGKCVGERVEVRCESIYKPDIYCGSQLNGTSIVSRNNFLIINLIADDSLVGRGFSGHFRFIK